MNMVFFSKDVYINSRYIVSLTIQGKSVRIILRGNVQYSAEFATEDEAKNHFYETKSALNGTL